MSGEVVLSSGLHRERSRGLFLRKFLRHGRRVASLAPSSRSLARVACRRVDPTRPQNIVELGAGTGAVTEMALSRSHPRSRLLAVELDRDFAGILRARCPGALVVEGDASLLASHLSAANFGRIDLLISGLALPSLPLHARTAILEAYRSFATLGTWFSQLTVMPLVFWRFYNRLFREVRFDWALWNKPPAGVYHCRGVRSLVRSVESWRGGR
jgi:phosphatidylethanolamine/phosphatidyl-N-methylethanolamine N-methyltransferase